MTPNETNSSVDSRRAEYRKTALVLIVTLVTAAMILLLLFTQVIAVVSYHGDGMEPGIATARPSSSCAQGERKRGMW